MRTYKNKKRLVWVSVVAVMVLAFALFACAPKQNPGNPVPKAEAPSEVPAADEHGVIVSSSWKDIYPNEYRTYLDNDKNFPPKEEYAEVTAETPDTTTPDVSNYSLEQADEKANYIADDQYPEIKILGKGYGYAKYYTEPAGHTFSLWSIKNNGRVSEKSKAQCITCKTPQFLYDVQGYTDVNGNKVDPKIDWTDPFYETLDTYDENIACANCHVNNDPTQLQVLREDWIRCMGDDADTASLQGQVCGQCHCDYSMDATIEKNGEPRSPYYGGLDSMTPDKALQFYDEYDVCDWVYESTGAKMLAVRHAEYEFCYGGDGNHMTNLGYDCNDCHMPVEVDSEGNAYTSHYWQSPLDNQELIDKDCSKCHADIKAEVKAWQEDIDGRSHEQGLRTADFIKNFEAAVAEGNLSDSDLSRLQWIQRAAAFYWNYAAAENSEGAHNPTLYNYCIDKGNELLDEGDSILGVKSEPKELTFEDEAA